MADARKSLTLPLIIAAVAAVALMVALIGAPDSNKSSSPAGESTSSNSASTSTPDDPFARRQPDDPLAKGEVDAPVVLVAYSEFQCPFCGKFARDTAPTLEKKYVEDGTLRIEWRDFPYLGPESVTAAVASRAAAAQDKFWEFHDAMYVDTPPPNSGNIDQAYVEAMARDIGLDMEDFRQAMSDPATTEAVRADFEEGQAAGVNGTPYFFINGALVIGAQPVKVFEQAIEEAASAAKNQR